MERVGGDAEAQGEGGRGQREELQELGRGWRELVGRKEARRGGRS